MVLATSRNLFPSDCTFHVANLRPHRPPPDSTAANATGGAVGLDGEERLCRGQDAIGAVEIIPCVSAVELLIRDDNLLPGIQSGFRKGHSTETLLLRLLSDVYAAIDSYQLTLLALFDVSAAFDTVDHDILLKRLNVSFGFSGTLLLWLRSFLTERSLCVVHGFSRSSWVLAPFGLPQGSVLAPLLFIIYTSDLASHALLAQLYADDVQAYQHCRASDAAATARAMSIAMEALGTWMSSNRLRLNSLKTKFIWLGPRQ